MAQDITIAGASFSDVPAIVVPKTGSGTATFLDTTISTSAASAGDIASGKLAYVNGSLITGTGGSGGYSKTLICPQQTFTGDGQRRATLTGMTSGLVDGAYYIVTYDGVEWLTTCETLWSTNLSIGEVQWFLTTLDSVYPFGVIWESGNTATVAAANTSQHTIKIEKLEFVGDPSLISKTITANGTYNASTDNVDGYSSVTVNISGGASNIVTGTFKGTTTGAAMEITLNYTGSGYPVAAVIYPKDGVRGDSTFNSLVQRYAAAMFCVTKAYAATIPAYDKTVGADEYIILHRYKSSTSNAGTYSQTGNQTYITTGTDATSSNINIMNFKSKTKMSVFIASSSYGFAANIEYRYVIYYSS